MMDDQLHDEESAAGQAEDAAEKSISTPFSDDQEDTQEVKISPEGLPEEVSEPLEEGRSEPEAGDDGETLGLPPSEGQESTPGWWAGEPFTPLESLDDEETQPIYLQQADDGLTELNQDEETIAEISSAPPEPEEDTRISPEETIPQEPEGETEYEGEVDGTVSSDDIPTIPPPNIPPDATPQNPNLPRSVSQIDKQATTVTPAAYHGAKREVKDESESAPSQETPPKRRTHAVRNASPQEKEAPQEKKRFSIENHNCFYFPVDISRIGRWIDRYLSIFPDFFLPSGCC